jgi:hypothetical protein
LAAAEIAYSQDPTPQNKKIVDALRNTAERVKTSTSFSSSVSDIGENKKDVGMAPTQANIEGKVSAHMDDWEYTPAGEAYRKAKKAGKIAEADLLYDEEEARARERFRKSQALVSKTTDKGTSTPPPKGKTATMADVDATVKASGRTQKEVIAALKAQGYTIK